MHILKLIQNYYIDRDKSLKILFSVPIILSKIICNDVLSFKLIHLKILQTPDPASVTTTESVRKLIIVSKIKLLPYRKPLCTSSVYYAILCLQ